MPHVGHVKFIEKSNLKIEIKSKRSESQVKDTDEYRLREVVEEQRKRYVEAIAECDQKLNQEQLMRDRILDSRTVFTFNLTFDSS